MDDPLVLLLAGLLVVMTIVAFWCARDIRSHYREFARGPIWSMYLDADLRAVVAGLIIVSIIVASLLGYALRWDPIPRPWGAVGLAIGYLLHLWGPISRWLTLRRIGKGQA
jgi:hypothetical protein